MEKLRAPEAETEVRRRVIGVLVLGSVVTALGLKDARAEAMGVYLGHLSCQAFALSCPVFLGLFVSALIPKVSFQGILMWRCVALSPLFIGGLAATDDYLKWGDSADLLVWQRLVSTVVNVPGLTGTLAAQTTEHIPDLIVILATQTISVIPDTVYFHYFAWLIFFPLYWGWECGRTWVFLHRHDAHPAVLSSIEEQIVLDLSERFRFKRVPRLVEVEANISPFVWCRRVVIPSAFHRGDPTEFKALLGHEFAHIKYWHGAFNILLDTVLWFFPLSYWFLHVANRYVEYEEEVSADAAAVRIGGVDKKTLKGSWRKYHEATLLAEAVRIGADEKKVKAVLRSSTLPHRSLGQQLFTMQSLTWILFGLVIGTVVGYLAFAPSMSHEEQAAEEMQLQEVPLGDTVPRSNEPEEQESGQPRREATAQSLLDAGESADRTAKFWFAPSVAFNTSGSVSVSLSGTGAEATTGAYIPNRASNAVSVIGPSTGTATTAAAFEATIAGEVIATFDVGATPVAVARTPYGSKVYAVNFNSNSVSVINTATNTLSNTVLTSRGDALYVANASSNPVTVIDRAIDLPIATVGSDKTVKLWNVADGSLVRTLEGHTGAAFYSVAFSPDERILASGATDETVRLWRNVADGSLIGTADVDGNGLSDLLDFGSSANDNRTNYVVVVSDSCHTRMVTARSHAWAEFLVYDFGGGTTDVDRRDGTVVIPDVFTGGISITDGIPFGTTSGQYDALIYSNPWPGGTAAYRYVWQPVSLGISATGGELWNVPLEAYTLPLNRRVVWESSGTLAEVAHTLISANALDGTTVIEVAAHSSGVYPSSLGISGVGGKLRGVAFSPSTLLLSRAVVSRDETVIVPDGRYLATANLSHGYGTRLFTVPESVGDSSMFSFIPYKKALNDITNVQVGKNLVTIAMAANLGGTYFGDGGTALAMAAEEGHAEIVHVLLYIDNSMSARVVGNFSSLTTVSYLQRQRENVVAAQGTAQGTAVRDTDVHRRDENRDSVDDDCDGTAPMGLLVTVWSAIWTAYLSIRNRDSVGDGCNGMAPMGLLVTVWSAIWTYLSMLSLFESALRMRKHRRKF